MSPNECHWAAAAPDPGPLPTRESEHAASPGLRAGEFAELKCTFQERCRDVADHDAVRLGALDQRFEDRHRRLLGLDVELGRAIALADEELTDVDRDLDGGAC